MISFDQAIIIFFLGLPIAIVLLLVHTGLKILWNLIKKEK